MNGKKVNSSIAKIVVKDKLGRSYSIPAAEWYIVDQSGAVNVYLF